jgi:hypothetical protein
VQFNRAIGVPDTSSPGLPWIKCDYARHLRKYKVIAFLTNCEVVVTSSSACDFNESCKVLSIRILICVVFFPSMNRSITMSNNVYQPVVGKKVLGVNERYSWTYVKLYKN